MIKIRTYGEVTAFCMGRSIGPLVPYRVYAFLMGNTLIDTGTAYARDEFMAALRTKRVSTVINTHQHEDHIGNNTVVHDAFGAAVYAHEDCLPYMADPAALKLKAYQRFVWGLPERCSGSPLGKSISCDGTTLQVIPSPGHSVGHVCLYEEKTGGLFTGDIFCGRAVRYLRRDEDFEEILSSLKNLARLDISTIFCSLKGIVNDGSAAIAAKIACMEDLKRQVRELADTGLSPREIRIRILGYEDAMHYLTAAHFSKQHVIDSILAGRAETPCL